MRKEVLRQRGCIENEEYYPVEAWIKYRPGEPMPEQFYTKKYGYEKLLYLWIRYRPGEPIPENFYYNGCNYSDTYFDNFLIY